MDKLQFTNQSDEAASSQEKQSNFGIVPIPATCLIDMFDIGKCEEFEGNLNKDILPYIKDVRYYQECCNLRKDMTTILNITNYSKTISMFSLPDEHTPFVTRIATMVLDSLPRIELDSHFDRNDKIYVFDNMDEAVCFLRSAHNVATIKAL